MSTLRDDIETALNCHSAENGSGTPDFILADYLTDCLAAYDKAVTAREEWYGRAVNTIGGVATDGMITDFNAADVILETDYHQ